MAEQFASGQMFHLQNKLRMAPLNIVRPRALQHIPRGRETVHLSENPVLPRVSPMPFFHRKPAELLGFAVSRTYLTLRDRPSAPQGGD